MRTIRIVSVIACAALVALASAGCRGKNAKNVTLIPGARGTAPGPGDSGAPKSPGPSAADLDRGGAINPTPSPEPAPVPLPPPGSPIGLSEGEFDGMLKDAEMFKANTVLFDFDKATVKRSEQRKIDEVAAYLKSSGAAANKMLVEGHCDERGTEEYNRALGERRALAIREYLVRAGVSPERVYTRSYGEDRPVDAGHNEAAWAKNRRGEFIVLKPKPLP